MPVEVVILRMRVLELSAIYMLSKARDNVKNIIQGSVNEEKIPDESTATPYGEFKIAELASPPSPP